MLRLREQRARSVAAGLEAWNSRSIPPSRELPQAEVSCNLGFEVEERATLAFHVAVASSAGRFDLEELTVSLDGEPLGVDEMSVDTGGRVHIVRCGPGSLDLSYRAQVTPSVVEPAAVTMFETMEALRQSRYCPSDQLEGFAAVEFDRLTEDPDRANTIASWVFERLRYELGSSGPLDTAVDTLLASEGVCRDFAHLTIALCRAIGVPARLVSVYAPGLSPMDFHAVAEVAIGGVWRIVDATRLAPRPTLVRIATGRDAADTAFCTTIDGAAELVTAGIAATTDADLPYDDHRTLVSLA